MAQRTSPDAITDAEKALARALEAENEARAATLRALKDLVTLLWDYADAIKAEKAP